MDTPAQFLTHFAKVVSTMNLYEDGHPARERAIDGAYQHLVDLQSESPRAVFTFLSDEVVFGSRALRELGSWGWGARLGQVGVQRLEFLDLVSRDDFEAFLEEIYARMSGEPISSAGVRQGRPSNIRYGEVGLRGTPQDAAATKVVQANAGYSLREEIDSVEWLHGELQEGKKLQMLEAEATVRSLSVAMHGDQAYMIPLVRMKDFDQYTVTHTLNVSVLTMALAECLGLTPKEVRMFGIAGLLHDMGKVTIPADILNKPGKLDDNERLIINSHTVEGARIIMETEEHLDLAAVVAYEHHIKIDGGGYPKITFDRACHQASNLVHVCDVFDALRTHRPYREAWPAERALGIIEEGAGPEFDLEIANAFVTMMRKWEGQITEVTRDDPEAKYSAGDPASQNGDGGSSENGRSENGDSPDGGEGASQNAGSQSSPGGDEGASPYGGD